uniref:Uncharacterized protein n=1 Tax=Arundo donax TaxID=35708 RepID=A0A0A9ET13_ARUDO
MCNQCLLGLCPLHTLVFLHRNT